MNPERTRSRSRNAKPAIEGYAKGLFSRRSDPDPSRAPFSLENWSRIYPAAPVSAAMDAGVKFFFIATP
jgi:hypothetical protein